MNETASLAAPAEAPLAPTGKFIGDHLAGLLLLGQIVGATFLQKFAVPVGGAQLYFAFFFMMGLTAVGILSGRLEIRTKAFAFYLAMVGGLCLTQLLGSGEISFSSLMLLLVMHIFYIFGLKKGTVEPNRQFLLFQKIMCACAVLGIIQFVLQFIAGPDIAFFVDTMLPDAFVQQGYNEMNPINGGGEIYKSTAFFFLEPAIYCQFLAVGLIVEMVYFKNIKRLILLIVAIALTFSGTGLICIFLLAPIYLLQQRKFFILSAAIVTVMLAPFWAPVIGLERVVDRASEFGSRHSSGYARFFSIIPSLNTYVFTSPSGTLFGTGAGSILGILNNASLDYAAHNPSWGKMLFEYGILGGLLYFMFMGYLIMKGQGSGFVKAALFLTFMVLGEYVVTPTVHGLILALLIWPPQPEKESAPELETLNES